VLQAADNKPPPACGSFQQFTSFDFAKPYAPCRVRGAGKNNTNLEFYLAGCFPDGQGGKTGVMLPVATSAREWVLAKQVAWKPVPQLLLNILLQDVVNVLLFHRQLAYQAGNCMASQNVPNMKPEGSLHSAMPSGPASVDDHTPTELQQ
jgi:hypothetical protein